ncbi:MAG: hypothetical protein D6731_12205 [Planctomycetota bacterium]|nr:MAG: hypothetical protein D6731_12205 [Planctomycetota bacterium]
MASDVDLATRLRTELARLRAEGRIPSQIRLAPPAWNAVRTELRFAAFGARQRVLFDGVPCALAVGLSEPFRIRCAAEG